MTDVERKATEAPRKVEKAEEKALRRAAEAEGIVTEAKERAEC